MYLCGLNSADWLLAHFCVVVCDPSGSIKGGIIINWKTSSFSRKSLLHGVSRWRPFHHFRIYYLAYCSVCVTFDVIQRMKLIRRHSRTISAYSSSWGNCCVPSFTWSIVISARDTQLDFLSFKSLLIIVYMYSSWNCYWLCVTWVLSCVLQPSINWAILRCVKSRVITGDNVE